MQRMTGLSFFKNDAVALVAMDSYRKAITVIEMYVTRIRQQLDWRNGIQGEMTCLEYLDLLFTQNFWL